MKKNNISATEGGAVTFPVCLRMIDLKGTKIFYREAGAESMQTIYVGARISFFIIPIPRFHASKTPGPNILKPTFDEGYVDGFFITQ